MYEQGQILSLRLLAGPPGSSSHPGKTIHIQIKSLPTEFTLSAVAVVDVLAPTLTSSSSRKTSTTAALKLPSRAFLKLYDPRYAKQLRHEWNWRVGDWSTDLETQVLEFARSGKMQEFLATYQQDLDVSGDANAHAWTPAMKEVALWDNMKNTLFKTEVEAYETLREHQGTLIPKLYSAVTYQYVGPAGETPEVFKVHGILIEYIDGFTMEDLHTNIAPSRWDYFVARAVHAVGKVLRGTSVHNKDVRPANLMVAKDNAAQCGYRFVMVDLGLCQFKGEDEAGSEWDWEKFYEREEGSMVVNMFHELEDKDGFEGNWTWMPDTWAPFICDCKATCDYEEDDGNDGCFCTLDQLDASMGYQAWIQAMRKPNMADPGVLLESLAGLIHAGRRITTSGLDEPEPEKHRVPCPRGGSLP